VFVLQVAEWRREAVELDTQKAQRLEKERQLHVQLLEERQRLKAMGSARRAAMRSEAAARAAREAELAAEEARRLAEERAREQRERVEMSLEEARERCVDDYWGLLTKWAYYRRLEEYKRKVWLARIADRRRRMIQVGNASADTDRETAKIRGEDLKEPWQRNWLEGTC